MGSYLPSSDRFSLSPQLIWWCPPIVREDYLFPSQSDPNVSPFHEHPHRHTSNTILQSIWVPLKPGKLALKISLLLNYIIFPLPAVLSTHSPCLHLDRWTLEFPKGLLFAFKQASHQATHMCDIHVGTGVQLSSLSSLQFQPLDSHSRGNSYQVYPSKYLDCNKTQAASLGMTTLSQ